MGEILYNIILWALLGPLFVLLVPIIAIVGGGAVLSPIAGFLSGLVAHRRGLNVGRFASVGFVYSLMFGFPWLCLMLGMLGRDLHRLIVLAVYILLYAIWLWFGVMWGMYFLFWADEFGRIRSFDLGLSEDVATIGAALLVCGGWCASLVLLLRTGLGSLAEWGSPEKGVIPYAPYIQPFGMLMAAVLITVAYFALA